MAPSWKNHTHLQHIHTYTQHHHQKTSRWSDPQCHSCSLVISMAIHWELPGLLNQQGWGRKSWLTRGLHPQEAYNAAGGSVSKCILNKAKWHRSSSNRKTEGGEVWGWEVVSWQAWPWGKSSVDEWCILCPGCQNKLGCIHNGYLFSHSLEARSPRIKDLARLVSSETSFRGLQMDAFSLCIHMLIPRSLS